jgi:hypothetical protein
LLTNIAHPHPASFVSLLDRVLDCRGDRGPLAELHYGLTDEYWTIKDEKWIKSPEAGKILTAEIRGDSTAYREKMTPHDR